MDDVQAALAKVEAEIEALGAKLERLEADVEAARTRQDLAEVAELRRKEEQLRTEKEQLRTKGEQLRAKELLLLRTALPTASAAPSSFAAVLERVRKLVIESPSKKSNNVLRPELAALCLDSPLVLRSALAPTVFRSFFELDTKFTVADLFSEAKFYELATLHVPNWVTVKPRAADAKQNAAALYGPSQDVGVPSHIFLPWQCEPELYTTSTAGHPAFSGELKSAGTGQATYNELLTYILFGIFHSLFPAGPTRRFYYQPPIGYGLAAFPHCGYLLGVEWIGKLLLYPISEPFVLGSDAHKAAVDSLPDIELSECIELNMDESDTSWECYPAVGPVQVSWTTVATAGGRFRKLIQCSAFDSHPSGGVECFRTLFATYASYSTALCAHSQDDPCPSALLEARLLFGAFAVLVDMPFVGTRECTDEDLNAEGPVLRAVVEAMKWLGRHRLLYVDLRARNVLRDAGDGVFLVDYDDMVVLSEPLQSGADVVRKLREHATQGVYACALDLVPPLRNMLEREP
jgi:hypothetical protein